MVDDKAKTSFVDVIEKCALKDLSSPFYYFAKGFYQTLEDDKIKAKQTVEILNANYRKERIEDLQYDMGLLEYIAKYNSLLPSKTIEKPKAKRRLPKVNFSYKRYD